MNSEEIINDLIDRVCDVDIRVKEIMNSDLRNFLIIELSEYIDNIIREFPHLVEEVLRRIVKYQSEKDPDIDVADFAHLVKWYSWSLLDSRRDKEYWNLKGEYFSIRMAEVINMFLITKYNKQCNGNLH